MRDKEVGTVEKIQLQQERNGNKYYHIFLKEDVAKTLNLQHQDLAKIRIRNQEVKEVEVNRKIYRVKDNTFKFSLPSQEADELDASSGDIVDLFISKP